MTAADVLTLERMRADVADLLGEAPEDIGDDDNLIDLGLDSMRVLGLVMRWGETGIALEFPHLAEHVTLAGWWATVQQLQRQAGQG
ncbi:phosphopantetheine-binding protein [Lysobacteraceae bacterium NML91-0213]|nr:phosphopantetheine-binding protein [Xanthomonadaceae bacterium NML91-0213]